MVKDSTYYKNLDLEVVAASWQESASRCKSADWRELAVAIAYRYNDEEFSADRIIHLLGEPDGKQDLPDGVSLLVYRCGTNEYPCSAHFFLRAGVLFDYKNIQD